MTEAESRPGVLYIAGRGRSGSTVLGLLLAQIPGCVYVGELILLWQRGVLNNELCGCGRPFAECEFWNAVLHAAFGSPHDVDAAHTQAIFSRLARQRSIAQAIWPRKTRQYRDDSAFFADTMTRLYRAIQAVSGASIIIDTSKNVPSAYALSRAPDIDLRLLHLVRDSRATIFSWQRKKIRPEIHWEEAYMPQPGMIRAAIAWNLANLMAHPLSHRVPHSLRLRYEDVTATPGAALSRLAAFLGHADLPARLLDDAAQFEPGIHHTVSGNPVRFKKQPLIIRPDIEWKTNMAARHRLTVTLLTWPLLLRYGYFSPRAGF